VVFLVDIFLAYLYKPLIKFRGRLKRNQRKKTITKIYFLLQHVVTYILKPNRNEFQDRWVIWISMIILLIVSYKILVVYKLWFNWMIPALLSSSYVIFMFISKPIQKILRRF